MLDDQKEVFGLFCRLPDRIILSDIMVQFPDNLEKVFIKDLEDPKKSIYR